MAFSKPVSAKVIQNAHELRHPAPAPAATPQELINSEPVSNGHNEPIESTAVESTEPIESWDEWKNRDEQVGVSFMWLYFRIVYVVVKIGFRIFMLF